MNRSKVAEVLKAPIIKLSLGWLQPAMYLSSDHSPTWQLMALFPGGPGAVCYAVMRLRDQCVLVLDCLFTFCYLCCSDMLLLHLTSVPVSQLHVLVPCTFFFSTQTFDAGPR